MRKFTRLTLQVEAVLRDKEHTRDSDIELTLWVWYTFYSDYLEWESHATEAEPEAGRWFVSLTSIRSLPSEDRISRTRRKFQESTKEFPNGKYPPTDPAVRAQRQLRAVEVQETINTPHWSEAVET